MSAILLPALARLPWHTWAGLSMPVLAASAILAGANGAATWLTPIRWTGQHPAG